MTIWQPFRSARTVLAVVVVLGGMTIAAKPAAASTTSGITCSPKTVTAHPAPGIGNTELFTVGSTGTVTLRQLSNTTLWVTDTDPTHGWKYRVISRTGTRPHVGFRGVGNPENQERFGRG